VETLREGGILAFITSLGAVYPHSVPDGTAGKSAHPQEIRRIYCEYPPMKRSDWGSRSTFEFIFQHPVNFLPRLPVKSGCYIR
jgi:predicted aminopeptidase